MAAALAEIDWFSAWTVHREGMKRRETLKLFGVAVAITILGAISDLSFAQDQKKMVTVVKIAGIPWFNALENGLKGRLGFRH